jgi:menaquinone-dependent protoporphyrinogen IX oxidase
MKILVVYYSRTGVTRKTGERIAGVLRQTTGVQVTVEEIVEAKDRSGVLGWLGAGRDAMRKRLTPINPVRANPADFDLVVIGSPVWCWTVSAPVRSFCAEHGRQAKKVAFFCTMGGSGDKKTFETMKVLCGRPPVATCALMERHVKKDAEETFLAKVKTFTEKLAGKRTEQ